MWSYCSMHDQKCTTIDVEWGSYMFMKSNNICEIISSSDQSVLWWNDLLLYLPKFHCPCFRLFFQPTGTYYHYIWYQPTGTYYHYIWCQPTRTYNHHLWYHPTVTTTTIFGTILSDLTTTLRELIFVSMLSVAINKPSLKVSFCMHFYFVASLVLNWYILTQFLSNRSQHVMVDGCRSKLVNVMSGVLQGSVLDPLLIILFTSELFFILENKLIGYGDDSTLMAVVPSPGVRVTV